MSDWREELKKSPLSFRGVRIIWTDSKESGGFNNDKKIYPSLGGWDIDQISQIPNSFSINGKLLGDDYLDKKKLLKEALLTPGKGALVLPGLGSVDVLVAKWSIQEKVDAKGMAVVSIDFDKYQPDEINFSEPDSAQILEDYSEQQEAATLAVVEKNMDISSDTLLLEAKKAFGSVFDEILNITAMLQGKTGPLADVLYEIEQAQGKLDTLVTLPGQMLTSLFSIMDSLVSFVSTGEQVFALVDPIRSCLQDFKRALKFQIDPGTNDQNEEIPKTQNSRMAEHTYTVLAFYGTAKLMESFEPWSVEDAEQQAAVLVDLSVAAESNSSDENEVIRNIRTQGTAVLYKTVQSLGLVNQKEIFLTNPVNALFLAAQLGTTVEVLQKFNRPENLFQMKGRILYV